MNTDTSAQVWAVGFAATFCCVLLTVFADETKSAGVPPRGQPVSQSEEATLAPGSAPAMRESDRETIAARIPAPAGFARIPLAPGSFGAWLRDLPLRPGRPPVHLYDGRLKENQTAHHAVIAMDVGNRNLQQCADAVMRLRAEYLYAGPCRDQIHFNFTSGDTARWIAWRNGLRPRVSQHRVTWEEEAAVDTGYANFRAYLDAVFTYAGSASLEQELVRVPDPAALEPGDVFIQGGYPGHAVIVVDVAADSSGERAFLLAQSYMPAQEIHVLRSFAAISPWYRARKTGILRTPEWEFRYEDLRRFVATECENEK